MLGLVRGKVSQILGLHGEPGARSGQVQDEPGSGVSGINTVNILEYNERPIITVCLQSYSCESL